MSSSTILSLRRYNLPSKFRPQTLSSVPIPSATFSMNSKGVLLVPLLSSATSGPPWTEPLTISSSCSTPKRLDRRLCELIAALHHNTRLSNGLSSASHARWHTTTTTICVTICSVCSATRSSVPNVCSESKTLKISKHCWYLTKIWEQAAGS